MTKKRRIALFMLIVVCVAMVFSAVFITVESDHTCEDVQCQICVEMDACFALLRGAVCGGAVAAVFCIGIIIIPLRKRCQAAHICTTPVSLKVKLTN